MTLDQFIDKRWRMCLAYLVTLRPSIRRPITRDEVRLHILNNDDMYEWARGHGADI